MKKIKQLTNIHQKASYLYKRPQILTRRSSKDTEDKSISASSVSSTKREDIIAVIAGCVILVIVVAGGVFAYSHLKGDSKPAQKQDARGYTLTPPEGWKKVDPTPEGASVAFAAATTESGGGKLKPFIVVQSAALKKEAQYTPFEAIAKAYVARLAQGYSNYGLVSTSAKTVGGAPAVLITFTSTSDTTALTIESLFTVKNGISYTINGGALTSTWSQHASQIEQSLLTFRP